ncbi:hypothetical protein [uncultured Marinobacter sp.]|uniref:hypothetical protein n=1 Tax=uncultured Marinobacter sp. TaxID=187379 RepID=UPI0030D84712|tara:strand:- start:809 stop:1090 length:282 start_codon:yes stop_codon:yes gene_type:complete
MNLLAGLLGYSVFLLTTLAIGGLGYIYADNLERWAKRQLRMSDARQKPPACSLFPLPAFLNKKANINKPFFKTNASIGKQTFIASQRLAMRVA